eukprot:m.158373 g.158373  ORF g.158373 m.158373 type:complete len:300 (-) comp16467_c0_seq13:115-1014(-)
MILVFLLLWTCATSSGAPSANDTLCLINHNALPPRTLQEFAWLHFPKAGTSFSTTLYHYACEGLPDDASPQKIPGIKGGIIKPFESKYRFKKHCNHKGIVWRGTSRAGHRPHLDNESSITSTVMMVRDPRHRLLSALHTMNNPGVSETRKESLRNVETIHEFVHFPGIAGCQVKMLTGSKCAEDSTVDEACINRAIANLKRAAFVGITDEWDSSICLFHAMFGGKQLPIEFHNVRPTNSSSGAEKFGAYSRDDISSIRPEDDPGDWRLYQAALALFRQRQREYGLPVHINHTDLREPQV